MTLFNMSLSSLISPKAWVKTMQRYIIFVRKVFFADFFYIIYKNSKKAPGRSDG